MSIQLVLGSWKLVSWLYLGISFWWFGTWILWRSIYWECHHPNWRTHIFQDGWNHQPGLVPLFSAEWLTTVNGSTSCHSCSWFGAQHKSTFIAISSFLASSLVLTSAWGERVWHTWYPLGLYLGRGCSERRAASKGSSMWNWSRLRRKNCKDGWFFSEYHWGWIGNQWIMDILGM